MLKRIYDNLDQYLQPNRALIIFGPRRSGKTTLLTNFLKHSGYKHRLDSGDNIRVSNVLSSRNFEEIKRYAEGFEIIAIDEAQKIPEVGMGLKIMVDQIPNIKIIATGSSSFDLAGQIGEPLVGRKRTLTLFPVSQFELKKELNLFDVESRLEEFMIFGSYPEVLNSKAKHAKIEALEEIVNSYLLMDILMFEKVKGSKIIFNLLKLLVFQVGSEVSLTELGRQLQLDSKTVARYLDLLAKSFVIYNLGGFSRNLRSEITQKSKYYFFDNGIMNAIINNYNDLDTRDDVGRLWENFIVIERLKKQKYQNIHSNNYFWRTWSQKEIDFLEEREGRIYAYEFKWREKKVKKPKEFLAAYPNSKFQVITRENYLDFLT